jgi:hypothetical protein
MTTLRATTILAAAAFMAQPAWAERIVGSCKPTAVKFVVSDRVNITASFTPVRVPDMALTFTQGGNAPSCIIVEVQAIGYAPTTGDRFLALDARLHGDNSDYITGTQPAFMAGSHTWGITNSHKFIWTDVAPGPHTVAIYYRAGNGDVQLGHPTMIIYYVP